MIGERFGVEHSTALASVDMATSSLRGQTLVAAPRQHGNLIERLNRAKRGLEVSASKERNDIAIIEGVQTVTADRIKTVK